MLYPYHCSCSKPFENSLFDLSSPAFATLSPDCSIWLMYEGDRSAPMIPQASQAFIETFLIVTMHLWMEMKLMLMRALGVHLFVSKLNTFSL
jgi:hypothetical protein